MTGCRRARRVSVPDPVAAGDPLIEARRLSVALGERIVLRDVDLVVRAGEVLTIVGPNGAGKSTLLAALAGDLPAAHGEVTICGQPAQQWAPSDLARRLALLPQQVTVAFPFTVEQIVRMGRAPWARTPAERDDDTIVEAAMERYGLQNSRDRPHTRLSGGERARVGLARVDAQATQIVLLDEPTASLDPHHQHLVLGHTRRLAQRGAGVVVVVHDLTHAGLYADRVALIDHGRVVAVGAPDDVLTADALAAVYRHPVTVIPHPHTSTPLVVAQPEIDSAFVSPHSAFAGLAVTDQSTCCLATTQPRSINP